MLELKIPRLPPSYVCHTHTLPSGERYDTRRDARSFSPGSHRAALQRKGSSRACEAPILLSGTLGSMSIMREFLLLFLRASFSSLSIKPFLCCRVPVSLKPPLCVCISMYTWLHFLGQPVGVVLYTQQQQQYEVERRPSPLFLSLLHKRIYRKKEKKGTDQQRSRRREGPCCLYIHVLYKALGAET